MQSQYVNIKFEDTSICDSENCEEFSQFYCTEHKIEVCLLCNIIQHPECTCKYIARENIDIETPENGLQIVKEFWSFLNNHSSDELFFTNKLDSIFHPHQLDNKIIIARDECELEKDSIFKQLYQVRFEKQDDRLIKICNRIKNQVIQLKNLVVESNESLRSPDPIISEKIRKYLIDCVTGLKKNRDKIRKLSKYSMPNKKALSVIKHDLIKIEEDFKAMDFPTISYDEILLLFQKCNEDSINPPGNGAPLDENFTLELFLYTRKYGRILNILKNFKMPPFRSLHVTSIEQDNEDLKLFSTNSIANPLESLCFNAFNRKNVDVSEYLPAIKFVQFDVFIGWFDVKSKDIEYLVNECMTKHFHNSSRTLIKKINKHINIIIKK